MSNEQTTGEQHIKKQRMALDELLAAEKEWRRASKRLTDARVNAHTLGISEEDIEYFEEASEKGWL